ncbi:MAG TPA: carboxypeptidase-like regulatory domain-containing protein, partial [Pyrinomonadaceae bacterium]|nr:carboxypeptidase-like regulatory domain-containing protein [Pyrinomonadaceae bacterium]
MAAIVLTFAASVFAMGQQSQGKIMGTVKDADGAILSNVEVSLKFANQAVARATVTDAEGKFTLDDVAPGTYQIVVQRTGFLPFSSAVHITSGDTKNLAIVLEI